MQCRGWLSATLQPRSAPAPLQAGRQERGNRALNGSAHAGKVAALQSLQSCKERLPNQPAHQLPSQQSSKQAGGRAGRQAIKQAGRQSSRQAGRQSSRQSSGQSSGQAGRRTPLGCPALLNEVVGWPQVGAYVRGLHISKLNLQVAVPAQRYQQYKASGREVAMVGGWHRAASGGWGQRATVQARGGSAALQTAAASALVWLALRLTCWVAGGGLLGCCAP